jgi:hypothetical protein
MGLSGKRVWQQRGCVVFWAVNGQARRGGGRAVHVFDRHDECNECDVTHVRVTLVTSHTTASQAPY